MTISISKKPLGLHLKQCYLTYQHQQVFADFSLNLMAGQWTCLLGRSGVGKSSLLEIMLGLFAPQQAVVTCTDQQALNHRASYLAQQDSLLPWLSVLDNVLLSYKLSGASITQAIKQQAIAILDQVGLANIVHLKPAQLSGGMRQRVALARILVEQKPIVLMDEPFSALDMVLKLELYQLAYKLLKHKTVLLITHDPMEAIRLSDVTYILSGTPARLSAPIIFSGVAPRSLDESYLAQDYVRLLNQLQQSH